MTCEVFKTGSGTVIICSPNIYFYKGFYIEEIHSGYCGYNKLKKNLDPAKKEGVKFWKAVNDIFSMSYEEKRQYKLN